MVIDYRDNTISVCEGGVWVYVSEIAEKTGASEEEVVTWLETFPCKDWVTEEIVNHTTNIFVELFNDDHQN